MGKSATESHPGSCFGSRLSPSPCMEELKSIEGPTAVQLQSRPWGTDRAIVCYWIPLVEQHGQPTWLQECQKTLFYDLGSIKHQEVSYPILIRASRKKKKPGIRNKNVNTDVFISRLFEVRLSIFRTPDETKPFCRRKVRPRFNNMLAWAAILSQETSAPSLVPLTVLLPISSGKPCTGKYFLN